MKPAGRLSGKYDRSQDSWLFNQDFRERLVAMLASYGYNLVDTPILESTELFLRKSGGELASRMYSFTDAGSNSVSLRPEFTAPIMRNYIEHAQAVDLPIRWQYSGSVFRYDNNGDGSGQYTQIGAELLGSDDVTADAEILSLAAQVPELLGLSGCKLELGNLDVLHQVLDTVGLSERARIYITSNASRLRKGKSAFKSVLEQSDQLHFEGHSPEDDYLSAAIDGLDDVQARKVLLGLLKWTGIDQLGQRKPEEIIDRLLQKVWGSDNVSKIRRGLELTAELVAIRGKPAEALDAARVVVLKAGADTTALDRFAKLVDLLLRGDSVGPLAESGKGERLILDFGLVRELAYYNGIVFELKHPASAKPIGGGGRYDGLARALGNLNAVPALGFAFTLDTLLALAEKPTDLENLRAKPLSALVMADSQEAYRCALVVAREVRQTGSVAELALCYWRLAEAEKYARSKGLSRVIMVSEDGECTTYPVD
jgi:histidyl-tRNA synthetase